MKISIEAETDAERKAFAEPVVFENVERACITGRHNDNAEIGWAVGPWTALKVDMTRTIIVMDEKAMSALITNSVINAAGLMAKAERDQAIAREVMGNGKAFKLHRP